MIIRCNTALAVIKAYETESYPDHWRLFAIPGNHEEALALNDEVTISSGKERVTINPVEAVYQPEHGVTVVWYV